MWACVDVWMYIQFNKFALYLIFDWTLKTLNVWINELTGDKLTVRNRFDDMMWYSVFENVKTSLRHWKIECVYIVLIIVDGVHCAVLSANIKYRSWYIWILNHPWWKLTQFGIKSNHSTFYCSWSDHNHLNSVFDFR